jgi:hypothetical protein
MITPTTDCSTRISVSEENIKEVCPYTGPLAGPGSATVGCMVDDTGFFYFTYSPCGTGINTENSG